MAGGVDGRYAALVATPFERIGGDRLRAVLEDFYDRVFADPMIGFLFQGSDRARLIDKEWELAATMLGGEVRYTGRPMRQAHARAPILGGHFERRQKLLRDTLDSHGVPSDVTETWLRHNEKLRPQVTADAGSGCDHERSDQRLRDEARRLPIASGTSAPSELDASRPPSPRGGENLLKIGRFPG